jgi:hypothetical protein
MLPQNCTSLFDIQYDENHITQPWVVELKGVEIFRANTRAKCDRHIQWKYGIQLEVAA